MPSNSWLGVLIVSASWAVESTTWTPVEYRPAYAVGWTLLFGLLTAAVFVGFYELALPQAGSTAASIGAFVVAVGLQFGSAILYARTR